MEQCTIRVLLTTCAIIALTLTGSTAQNCSDLVTINASSFQALVNRSISRTCLRCVDGNMMSDSSTLWATPNGTVSPTGNPAPELFELVDGVLVLLDPMQLLEDGDNSYEMTCTAGTFEYNRIEIYSSTFLPPIVSAQHIASEGEDPTISCDDPNANPLTGSAQWLDPSGNVASQSRFLTLTNINRTQAGEYVCQLTSSFNQVLSATTNIIVHYAPTISSEDPPAVLLVPGASTTLSCVFTGLPTPSVTWHYQNMPVDTHRFTVDTRDNRSELTLSEQIRQREGVYRCTVTNSEGNSSIQFSAQSLPEIVEGLVIDSTSETSVSLSWLLGFRPRAAVSVEVTSDTTLIRNQTVGGDVTSVTIPSLSPLTSYTFTVYAVSEVGRSDQPAIITASTLSLKVSPPTITTLQAPSFSELFIQWEAPPIVPATTSPLTGWRLVLSSANDMVLQNRTENEPGLRNYTFVGLEPDTQYRARVAGINIRGTGNYSATITNSTRPAPAAADTGSGATTAVVVSILIIVLLTIAVAATLVIVFIRKKQHLDKWGAPGSVLMYQNEGDFYAAQNGGTAETSCAEDSNQDTKLSFERKQSDIPLVSTVVDIGEEITEPVGDKAPEVLEYKKETVVCEGRQVTLRVIFTGNPTPTVTWELDGNTVKGDYAVEIGRDGGSLFFICVEKKHSGKYCFKVSNRAGTVEGTMSLVVKDEQEEIEEKESTKLETKTVEVAELGEYVAGMHSKNNSGFIAQFQTIPTGETLYSSAAGKQTKNKQLNRFKNILPYDDHQIQLEPFEGIADCQNDYINASPIAFQQPKTYIACQGPLPHTITDFWRMVWQEEVGTIAMVTNLQEKTRVKCERYWPEMGSEQHGPFKITLIQTLTFADYIIRDLQVEHLKGENLTPRKVTHYHFISWPDHGVPEYAGPILNFLKKVKSKSTIPTVVHCSAGVGRTGTLIAIDMALILAPEEGTVDIPSILNKLRSHRMKMVQTVDQFIFIHDAVLESLSCGDTQIAAGDLRKAIQHLKDTDTQTEKTGFETQFQVLGQLSPKDSEVIRATAFRFSGKNRNMLFLPPDKWRCCLQRQLPDYIHASFADGYKQKKGFIVAQAPMENTVSDFWKLISDSRCGVVVMLSELEEEGEERCVQYWPTEGDSTEYGQYLVTTMKQHKNDGYIQRVLTVTNPKSRKLHKVVQFQLKGWSTDGTCSNPGVLVEVIDHMAVVQRRSGNRPILVHGKDTVSRVSVFCCLVNAIDLCKTEGTIDVFQVVKALRIQKPGSIQTVQQYSFIFDVLLLFLDSFSIYANFK